VLKRAIRSPWLLQVTGCVFTTKKEIWQLCTEIILLCCTEIIFYAVRFIRHKEVVSIRRFLDGPPIF
jgi:hypothetical protein